MGWQQEEEFCVTEYPIRPLAASRMCSWPVQHSVGGGVRVRDGVHVHSTRGSGVQRSTAGIVWDWEYPSACWCHSRNIHLLCRDWNYHDRRASEDAVFALRELTRRVNAKQINQ